MKNFSKILIAGILGMFLIAGTSFAVTVTGNGTYVGGVVSNTVFVGDSESTAPTLEELENPQSHQDSYDNVILILNEYNDQFDPDLPDITTSLKFEISDDSELYDKKEGTIALSPGTEYISLKWDADAGGWFLWYVKDIIEDTSGVRAFDFGELSHGLSHYTEWNPVPAPATIFLLGSGLIGFAGLKRKFKK